MQAEAPATPVSAAGAAATAAITEVAAPPTPLEQRQWQRLAQRAIRVAVTAFKDGSTRFADASAAGTAEATQLTNSLLSQRYMPDMSLPAALQQVPGLQAAAASKLHRQQLQHLQQLQDLLDKMQAAVKVGAIRTFCCFAYPSCYVKNCSHVLCLIFFICLCLQCSANFWEECLLCMQAT
jgi:hypothetical protein